MRSLDEIEATIQHAMDDNDPMLIQFDDMVEMIAEIKALRNVEMHARTSVGKLLLSAWAHSLSTYFDGLASAIADLDHLRNK